MPMVIGGKAVNNDAATPILERSVSAATIGSEPAVLRSTYSNVPRHRLAGRPASRSRKVGEVPDQDLSVAVAGRDSLVVG